MRRFLITIAVFLPVVAAAQTGEWGSRGVSRRFVLRGDRVFAADGRGVAVYDVSSQPIRRIAVAETSSESLDLASLPNGDLAVATRGGLERYAFASSGALTLADPNAVASVLASNARYLAGATPTGITIWDANTLDVVSRFPLTQPISALAWHRDTLIAALPGVGLYFLDAGGDADPIFAAENAR